MLKQKVYFHYLQVVNDKIEAIQKVLADLKESSTNETKSTAGDKHETALAMLQIEQSNKRAQLREAQLQKAALEKIDPAINATVVLNGSLIKTSRGYMFMSTALGKAVVENIPVIALSAQSPLGLKLMGLRVGETILLNGNTYLVEQID